MKTLGKRVGRLLLILFLAPLLAQAEQGITVWSQRYNGSGNGTDWPRAVAVDGSNNVVVAGYSRGTDGHYDYATLKYSGSGVLLWTNRYSGPGNNDDTIDAMAIDKSNNVVVTGHSCISFFGIGRVFDYTTIKYSSAGVPVWTNHFNQSLLASSYPNAIAIDANNDIIVTGQSYVDASTSDFATVKYAGSGTPLWTNLFHGSGVTLDYATALAVNSSNEVVVVGALASSGGVAYDYLTIKYSSSGLPVWVKQYDGPADSDDRATAVAIDHQNNILVTGYSSGAVSGYDYTTIKYSNTGALQWTTRYSGSGTANDSPSAVAIDSGDDVFVTGDSYGNGHSNIVTIKYSSAGSALWTNIYSGPANQNDARDLAVDHHGNIIVTGSSHRSTGGYDFITIKYASGGGGVWTNLYNGTRNGNDGAVAVALDQNGNPIVTGYSISPTSLEDIVTIKYVSVPEPSVTGHPMSGGFQVQITNLLQPGTLIMQVTADLTNWTSILTNTVSTNCVLYNDPGSVGSPFRFYRAFQFP